MWIGIDGKRIQTINEKSFIVMCAEHSTQTCFFVMVVYVE